MGEDGGGGRVQLISKALFEEVREKAAATARRRLNHNFHRTMEANPHRFLNVFLRGSYLTPHRHIHPPKDETFLVLEGRLLFVEFDEEGEIAQQIVLGYREEDPGATVWGVDVAAGVWHTVAALSEHAVCFEVKPGPFNPIDDKDFAPWAPRETEPGAAAYLEDLLARAARWEESAARGGREQGREEG